MAQKKSIVTELEKKIKAKEAIVGVIGLGYVGLPLSVEFANSGFTVIGFDIDKKKIKVIAAGKSDVDDVPEEEIKKLVF